MLNIFVTGKSDKLMRPTNNTSAFRATDHDLWEYILVANPDKEVSERIMIEKTIFDISYDQDIAAKTTPHIPIASFLAKEVMELTLNRWIQNVCNLHHAFDVTLNNYSSFPPHTIYLRVLDPVPLKKLANQLKIIDAFIQTNDLPNACMAGTPHIAVASKLPEHVYDKAVRDYAQRCFCESFRVEKIVLLKRSWEGAKYELVNTFTLAPYVAQVS
jgi:2'-5' RNA ligase